MEKPHNQENSEKPQPDYEAEKPGAAESLDMQSNMEADDDFIDDWISHVDDYDNSDDINNW
jgi:hypothetical protein